MINHKFKIAFIGGGINSAVGAAHFSAINIDNLFELVSGCFSRDNKVNYNTAVKYKVPFDRTYPSIETLIDCEKNMLDAVVVLTPQDQHFNQVLKLIKHNIPVICEKALAASIKDVLEIKSALESNLGFLAVIYNYLGYPMIRELKYIIQNNHLGTIKHIQVEMPLESFIRVTKDDTPVIPQNWRLKDTNVPTISLDLAVHLHMLIKYLISLEPLKVIAISESLGNFNVIDNINCLIKYSNNIICNMWYSKIAIGNRNGMKIRVYGDRASAEWVQEFPEILSLADVHGRRWKMDRGNEDIEICSQERYTRFKVGHPAGYVEAFANYYHDIALALNEYKNNHQIKFNECFGIDEAYEGIKLLTAIQKSSESMSWENV